jgi:LmbE family N-acetylglucosaminyl deacetylase
MAGATLLVTEPATALAIYAHPDDLEVSCGGTLARWGQAGCAVHLVVCTRGDKGSFDAAADTSALSVLRADEARHAAEVLGARDLDLLGYDDGSIHNDIDLRRQLVGIVRRSRPDIVVCPDPTATFFGSTYVNHHDHREVGWATIDACAPAAASPLYYPEAGAAHGVAELLLSGTLEPDVWVDITDTVDGKVAALRCHRSQVGGREELLEGWVRQRAGTEGAKAGVRYAESFRRIQLSGV